MSKSIYHLLNKTPAIYAHEMLIELEDLASQLVKSGRLRIDTDYYCNFVRYNDPKVGTNIILSNEELKNPKLLSKAKLYIKETYDKKNSPISDDKLDRIIRDLRKKAARLLMVSEELKMRLARILVQSAHPIVIKWLINDRVEIFVTYTNSIGDVMDISNWKTSGGNSGMQSTDGVHACVYVSCGGDPFAKNREDEPRYGDGWAALARLQIIVAQEMGHYADIVRDEKGNQITRHSCNFSCTKPKENVKKARFDDIAQTHNLLRLLTKIGLNSLAYYEEKKYFYKKNKIRGLRVIFICAIIAVKRKLFLWNCKKHKLNFAIYQKTEKYMAMRIKACLEDMLTHLSPLADVYKRENPDAEEAIACAESLARVPQQVVKWGHLATKASMGNLYFIYYAQVIPSLIKNYQLLKKKKYKPSYNLSNSRLWIKFLKIITLGQYPKQYKFVKISDV